MPLHEDAQGLRNRKGEGEVSQYRGGRDALRRPLIQIDVHESKTIGCFCV